MSNSDLGPLFDAPAPARAAARRASTFWELESSRAARAAYEQLDAIPWPSPAIFASIAAATDTAERLLLLAAHIANCLLDATGEMSVWQVRIQLMRLQLIGSEDKLDCLGALGTRMGLTAIRTERPPNLPELDVSHRNRNTVWARRESARRSA